MERLPWPARSAIFGSTSIVSVMNMTKKNYTSGKTRTKELTTTTNSFARDVKRRQKRRSRQKQQRAKRKENARRGSANARLIEPSMRDARFGRRRRRRKSGENGKRRRDWRCRMLLLRMEHRCLPPLGRLLFREVHSRVPPCQLLIGRRCRQGRCMRRRDILLRHNTRPPRRVHRFHTPSKRFPIRTRFPLNIPTLWHRIPVNIDLYLQRSQTCRLLDIINLLRLIYRLFSNPDHLSINLFVLPSRRTSRNIRQATHSRPDKCSRKFVLLQFRIQMGLTR